VCDRYRFKALKNTLEFLDEVGYTTLPKGEFEPQLKTIRRKLRERKSQGQKFLFVRDCMCARTATLPMGAQQSDKITYEQCYRIHSRWHPNRYVGARAQDPVVHHPPNFKWICDFYSGHGMEPELPLNRPDANAVARRMAQYHEYLRTRGTNASQSQRTANEESQLTESEIGHQDDLPPFDMSQCVGLFPLCFVPDFVSGETARQRKPRHGFPRPGGRWAAPIATLAGGSAFEWCSTGVVPGVPRR